MIAEYFINLIPGSINYEFLNNNRSIISNFGYSYTNFTYSKINAGISSVKLINTPDSLLFNTSCNLDTNANYTMLFYSIGNSVSAMMLSDSIDFFSSSNSFYRFIHASNDYSDVTFKITDNQSFDLPAMSSTSLKTSYAGKFIIVATEIASGKIIAQDTSVIINPGKIYNFILRGNSSKSEILKIETAFLQ